MELLAPYAKAVAAFVGALAAELVLAGLTDTLTTETFGASLGVAAAAAGVVLGAPKNKAKRRNKVARAAKPGQHRAED